MSRTSIVQFCHAILNDNQYSNLLPANYKENLSNIDITFTKDNIDTALKQIYENIFYEKLNLGRIISSIGFADILRQRYSWCNIYTMLNILTDVLIEVRFNPEDIKEELSYLTKSFNSFHQ